ncbi:MAG: hypothetical protein WDA16_09060 [Candidatus Thermoplasmatota archaeon]
MICGLLSGSALLLAPGVGAQTSTTTTTPCLVNGSVLGQIVTANSSSTTTTSRSQDVSLTESNVLIGLALRNAGATDVTFAALRGSTVTTTATGDVTRTASLTADNALSALALGLTAGAINASDALACISDLGRTSSATTTTTTQSISLNENTALAAIALARATGTAPSLADVGTMSSSTRTTVTIDQTVNIDAADALRLLALLA